MKTYKRLDPKIYEFENLYWAFRKARKGKRSRPDVAAFECICRTARATCATLTESIAYAQEIMPAHQAGADQVESSVAREDRKVKGGWDLGKVFPSG